MKIFSTFTGIGGFEIGIQNAFKAARLLQGVDQRPGETSDGESLRSEPSVVGYSEIDKYAISVYERHFKGVKNYGDITQINASELPDFDCLVGGFPCQAFSVAGLRRGFEDTRGTLFFDLARILKEKQPRLFVFENVKGLLSHDQGRTFTTIITTLDELGYDCQWQVLNSKNFGVPQNRERVIIVGHLRGEPRPQVFPIGEDSGADFVLPTLTARYHGAQANGGYIGHESPQVGTYRTHKDGQGFRESQSGLVPTIPARAREDGSGQPVIVAQRGRGADNTQVIEQRPDGNTNTLTSVQKDNMVLEEMRVRRLTPIECERLQAFPDNWTQLNAEGGVVSDTQRYKMAGNAVTTNVIQAVFERIFAHG